MRGPLSTPPPGAVTLAYRHDQRAVRRFAADRARLAGLSPERTTDLVIAVAEVAANTLAHTSGPGILTVWVADGDLICQIQDSGQITDPRAGTRRPDAADPSRGRGLWLVHQVCDLVEMRTGPGGTTTRLHMRLDGKLS
jgi:anti-sigma regulatory factor (Ser/Thr protein kinase)